MRAEHVTRTPTNGSAVFSRVSVCITWPVYCTVIGGSSGHLIRKFWFNLDRVLCQFLETGTSDRWRIGIVQLLRFSGFSLYPLSFWMLDSQWYNLNLSIPCYSIIKLYAFQLGLFVKITCGFIQQRKWNKLEELKI